MRIVVQNIEHGGQRGAAEGTEERAGPFSEGARGEVGRLLQHDMADRGRPAGGASPDYPQAGGGFGRPSLRAHKGGLEVSKRGNGEGSITRRKNGGWMA